MARWHTCLGTLFLSALASGMSWPAGDGAPKGLTILEEGRAALKSAFMLRGQSGKEQEMIAAYNRVVELGMKAPVELASELELASNNLGVYYASRDPELAVQQFQRIAKPSNKDAFVFHFNYGRTLEKLKNETATRKAYEQYWLSLQKQPLFQHSADSIGRLLLTEQTPRFGEARRLIKVLTESEPAQVGAAQEHLSRFLKEWGKGDLQPELVGALVRVLAAGQVDARRYESEFRERLQEKDRSQLDLLFKDEGHQFRNRGEEPLIFKSSNDVCNVFSAWKPFLQSDADLARDISRLLAIAGNGFANAAAPTRDKKLPENPEKRTRLANAAIARHSAAFMLDPTNAASALSAATLIEEYTGGLDKPGSLLRKFIDSLYDGKIDLLKEALTRNRKEDWIKVYYVRIVLADLYVKIKEWGDERNYHSVLGQLHLAIKAEAQIQAKDPLFPASPLIRESLGKAYKAKDDHAKAAVAFTECVEGMILRNNRSSALVGIESARACDPMGTLAARLDFLEKVSGVEPEIQATAGRSPNTGFYGDDVTLLTASSTAIMYTNLTLGETTTKHTWEPGYDNIVTAFSPRTGLAAWKSGKTLKILDKSKWHEVEAAAGVPLVGLEFSPNGKLLAAACADCVRIVDIGSKSVIRRLDKPQSGGGPIAFSEEGDLFAAAVGQRVLVWPSKEGPISAEFALPIRPASKLTALAFSGRDFLAIGNSEGTLQLCSLADRKTLATFHDGVAPLTALAFSRDGRTLASGDQAGAVRLYSTEKAREIGPLPGAVGQVSSLSFAFDKLTLAVGVDKQGSSSEVRIFKLSGILP